MKKKIYALIGIVVVICVIFSLKGVLQNKNDKKTLIFRDLRPVLSISFNPKNRNIVYAGCGYYYGENNAVVKSSNYGKKFKRLKKGLMVAVNPINPDTIFVANQKELFKTEDAGRTWSKIDFKKNLKSYSYVHIYDMKISQKTGALYLLTTKGLLISEDNGMHFEAIEPEERLHYHKIFPGSGKDDTIYICVSKGNSYDHMLLKSSDNGKSWEEIDKGLKQHLVTALAESPKDKNTIFVATSITAGEPKSSYKETGIFKSTDGGMHWKNIGSYSPVHALAVDPYNTNIVYAGTDKGLLKSADSGKTWKEVKLEDNKEIPIYAIRIDSSSNIIYLGTGGAIYRIKEDNL